ncbi:CPSF A subunit region-domain-containing protein [Irpex rosettiformis]|uniref:CPSF A subunit region-domain-containing protein n=1 Tax=Irpex rosettiformis TaxID=378272 RepID=A0ACB8TQA5_9APHY|nr:CPSF A subunit region-domain-containing protein [Irpex rosettiformis]
MKIVSTFVQPSSVTSSVKCSLTPEAELGHLVVAKASCIEVSSITAEGLNHECSLEIWGRVLSVKAVPAKDPSASNLLVLLDHPHPKLLLLGYKTQDGVSALSTLWHSDLQDRYARHAEFFTGIVTSAFGEVAVVSCYVGKLKVIAFNEGKVSNEFDVILPELNLLSLAFVETDTETYTLAILHIDHLRRVQLLARDLDIGDADLSITPSRHLQRAILASSSFPDTDNPLVLVPVPSFSLRPSPSGEDVQCLGGVFVLGGRKIIFVEAATIDQQHREKGKEKRQQQRKSSTSERVQRQAKQKEKEREAKKVKSKAAVKWPWSEVTAWCPADDDGRRFFIGDIFGRLSMLTITDTPELILLPIGEISAPTTLSYLSSQVLYVGSHTGDAQILRIHATAQSDIDRDTLPIPSGITTVHPTSLSADPRSSPSLDDDDIEMESVDDKKAGKAGKIVALKGTHIEVLDRFRNLAPILDAVLADTDESGQPQIVTCSGGANTGALNVIRTGADFQELAVLKEFPNVARIFSIRNSFEEQSDTHIILSTLHESHILRIDGRDTLTRLESGSSALATDQPTLALANVARRVQRTGPTGPVSAYADSAYVVQITPKGINLLEFDTILGVFNRVGAGWTPEQGSSKRPREIVAASVNASQFVVALNGGTIILLNLGFDGMLNVVKSREFPGREISAVSCAPLDSSKAYTSYIAVAFWGENNVQLLSLKDQHSLLEPFCTSPSLPALPCSVILHNFGTVAKSKDPNFHPYVVVGLADGSVATLSIQGKELKELKLFPLGAAPVSLNVTEVDGRRMVFASGSRTAVFYWERQRLMQSSVMMKDVAFGASLNATHFPSCQILATSSSLHIGQIRGIDKMQVRSVKLGMQVPRRIAYHSGYNVFGVVCTNVVPHRVGESEMSGSSFNLIDGVMMTDLSQFNCETDEDVTAVKSLSGSSISASAAFCVGTLRAQVGEREPSLGRLLLFEISGPAKDLKLISSREVDGCVYAIDAVNGLIAAAVNTSVDLYAVIHDEESESTTLKRVARWNHNYFVTSLVAKDDRLIVGDGISSVSVLQVKGHGLETIARDYTPLWPQCVEGVKDKGVIGANVDCNLFTFSIADTDGGRKRLERNGYYHIGDVVTKFIPGSLSVQDTQHDLNQTFEPEHVFFTSSGRIGVVAHVSEDVALALTDLQRNMAAVIVGPGDVNHSKWHTPSNARGTSDADQAVGFLDGDFLEQFLTYDNPDTLLKGKSRPERVRMEREKMEEVLEKLQSLH